MPGYFFMYSTEEYNKVQEKYCILWFYKIRTIL